MKIRVFLADDHRILRDGLRLLLETQGDFVVAGEAENGRLAAQQIVELRPDLALMDISMPELNGIEATRLVKEKLPDMRIIVLSVHSDSEHIFRAFHAGASGYMLKESAGSELIEAIQTVLAGGRYISPKIAHVVLEDYIRHRETHSPLEQLTQREREVLQLTVEGNPSVEIASRLGLSPKTVETYRSRIMEKLDVRDITELVRFAVKHGMISVD